MSAALPRSTLAGLMCAAFVAAFPLKSDGQQVGAIAGRVTSDTGEPVAGAQILVQGTRIGVVARADGAYALVGVPTGTHVVIVERIGYQTLRQEGVVVTAGQTTTTNLIMEPTRLTLQEIVVTGLVDPPPERALPDLRGARAP